MKMIILSWVSTVTIIIYLVNVQIYFLKQLKHDICRILMHYVNFNEKTGKKSE